MNAHATAPDGPLVTLDSRRGPRPRRAATQAGLALVVALVAGCNSGLPSSMMQEPQANNSTASGAINGTFTSTVTALYNLPKQTGLTRFRLNATRTPALKMTAFLLAATLSGPPAVSKTYGMESQIIAEFDLDDGSVFEGGLNSQLHLYFSKVGEPVGQTDGSSLYEVHGHAEGICNTTKTVDTIQFTVDF